MTVDPGVVNLLRDTTRIEMRSPKISLDNPNISSLLTGNTLELVPGEGQPRNQFPVLPADKNLLQAPGIDADADRAGKLWYRRGTTAGTAWRTNRPVLERTLTNDGVSFAVAIDPQYRSLVHGDSKFVVNSRIDVKVGLDGVEFLAASASEWVSGGIRILPGDKGEMKKSYPLFANLDKALENSLSDLPTTTLTLTAETLPDVQTGSVVLYRKFEVGQVITVRPRANAFDIDLHIKPEYRDLLTTNSVFWAEGGAKVQLNGSGLTVQASPLSRAIKGAISFDNLSGASGRVRKGDKRVLYASETAARAVGGQITLHTFDAGKLAAGMPIRYTGIDIGRIS